MSQTTEDRFDGGYFDEERSAEVVNSRIGEGADPRLKEVVGILTRHLHNAVKEIEPTHEEWFAAIRFLTETGQMCNDWRQEYILLSDVLGVTMLVDAINHRRPSGATPNTILGPFYVEGAPHYANGANICLDHKGEPTLVRGRIMDVDGNPVAGARIDVWQTNDDGFYDVQQKGEQPEYNLRGVFASEADGRYWFRAAKPKYYPIPDDGPVGQLLRAMGRHPYRPAHLHYIVSAEGFTTLVTHIFDPDDPYIRSDAVFGVKESLLADFQRIDDARKAKELGFTNDWFWSVNHDFVLAR